MWWNGEVKAAVRRKEAAWKEVLAVSNEAAKARFMGSYRKEKRKVERCIYQSTKKINEEFGRKMSKDVNGNRKLFWKEVSNGEGEKVESYNRIKEGNKRLAQGEDEVRRIWKEYFENLYTIDLGCPTCGVCDKRGPVYGVGWCITL